MTVREANVTSPERAAEELLETIWAPDTWPEIPIPVNPIEIADSLDVKVYFAGLDEGVSGMLVKRVGRDAEIYINGGDSRNRQRFTCAHELGHYVKRMAIDGDGEWGFVDRRSALASQGTDRDEIYANRFAASLLMPKQTVLDMHDDFTVAVLAAKFGVSAEAMGFRLDSLSLR
jgi:predicted transcriptional regulator